MVRCTMFWCGHIFKLAKFKAIYNCDSIFHITRLLIGSIAYWTHMLTIESFVVFLTEDVNTASSSVSLVGYYTNTLNAIMSQQAS